MPGTKLVHINRHDTVTANLYVGVEGEVTMDTGTRELRTHDGVAAGGQRLLTKTQNDLTYQPLAADLTSLAGFGASTGIVVHAALNTSVLRTLTAPAAGITVTNPGGVAGNPTFVLANDLAALEGLAGTGFGVRTTTDTWANRSLAAPASGLTITNPDGVSGNPTFALANDLGALEALAGTGIAVRSGADTWVQRSITQPAAGIVITNNDGVAGNPTLALANDLSAVEGLAATGLAARTAADTWTTRSLTQPAAGFTITNNDAVAGNPTFALANDLAAVEGLAGTGIAVRTATDTWANRTIAVTAGQLTVTNGDGVAANPTLGLPAVGPGAGATTIHDGGSITLDAQGRVTAITAGSRNTVILQDQKTAGTNGQAFTATTWNTRDLTTKVVDTGGICTLTANHFVLAAGTYEVIATAQHYVSGASSNCKVRLRNTTDGVTLAIGEGTFVGTGTTGWTGAVVGRFTIGASKNIEFQSYSSTAGAIGGTAISSGEVEVYAQVYIVQVG